LPNGLPRSQRPERPGRRRRWRWAIPLALWVTLGSTGVLRGILFVGTDDPTHNTQPPAADLEGSGWQYLGRWGRFLGTPVHPRYFLTAAHVGGRAGDVFTHQGVSYVAQEGVLVPGSDLRLWRICGTFPDYAPVHRDTNVMGSPMIWFGRGTRRGVEVTITNAGVSSVSGWRWGTDDRVIRWGSNRVEELVEVPEAGFFLRAAFDPDAGPDECHLSTGDSGGPVFVRVGEEWQLAGINYAVDGPYSYQANGAGAFQAALFNHAGLYRLEDDDWIEASRTGSPEPGSLYATAVSAYADWILDFLGQPVPPEEAPILQTATQPQGTFIDSAEATVDWVGKVVTLPVPDQPVYLRLRGCQTTRVLSLRTESGQLRLSYE